MNSNRLEQLLKLSENAPDDTFIKFAIAKEYEGLGDMSLAMSCYISLVENHPQYIGTYYHLGKMYERMNDIQAAIDIYEKGIQVAKVASDFHSLSELNSAKTILEM